MSMRIDKAEADYTDGPEIEEPCQACTMFVAPHRCTLVRGSISPMGHCKFFQALAKMAYGLSGEMGAPANGGETIGAPRGSIAPAIFGVSAPADNSLELRRGSTAGANVIGAYQKGSTHTPADPHVRAEHAVAIPMETADPITQSNVYHISWAWALEGRRVTERREVPVAALIALQPIIDTERVAAVKAELQASGEMEPALVVEWDDDLFVIDGHHHIAAAKELEWDYVPVEVIR